LYNEACALALDGEFARALGALTEAIDSGFFDLAQIETDGDLDNLRGLPDFQGIVGRLERRTILAMIAASQPFPFDFRLGDLDGKTTRLADFQGKVLVVAFWGTWSSPGRKLVPHLADLYGRFHDKGLEVVGLAYENEPGDAPIKAVRAFAREHGIVYPCLVGDEATRNQVTDFAGYPTTLVIDRAGKVRLRLNGYQPLSSLETAATYFLGETAESPPKAKGPAGDNTAASR
ncbi:MAG: TlpA family protein disulfide reductase, partial [Planctomycetia bacterium]|nr:TlpA family protein disulfide reductase [Planctomycetia bacterium]